MAHFDDLTPYSYHDRHRLPMLVNVGWIDRSHEFARGDLPHGLLNRLSAFCEVAVAATRGFHECEFCRNPTIPVIVNGLKLGSAEIRVFAGDGTIFAAPNLILHYVEQHRYRPPSEFIDAVMTSCVPPSAEYYRMAESNQIATAPCPRSS